MPKSGGGIRRKRRTHKTESEEDLKKIPKSFVIKRGKITAGIKELVTDWRCLMSPYSAMKLKDHQKNKLKDFISVSSVFGVTHVMMFTQSGTSPYWKIAQLPNGPSLTFRVHEFSLCSDIRSFQQKPRVAPTDFLFSPLVVLNGFRETSPTSMPLKLIATLLGHMFPVIEVNSVSAKDCRRVVLFHCDKAAEMIDVRHYRVIQRPAGISRNIKKLIRLKSNSNKFLDLGNKKDVSDFVLTGCGGSESEGEDASEVYTTTETQPEKGNVIESSAKLAISLQEIGPRLKVQLVKIEEEVFAGKVLYHKLIKKTPEEVAELAKKEEKMKNKRKREAEILEQLIQKRHKKIYGENEKRSSEKVNEDAQNSNDCYDDGRPSDASIENSDRESSNNNDED